MASPHVAGAVALVLSAGITDAGTATACFDDVKAHLCATQRRLRRPADSAAPDPTATALPELVRLRRSSTPTRRSSASPPGRRGGAPAALAAAVDDTATTNEDTATDIAVLANDTDPDGDPLSVTGGHRPAARHRHVNPNGTVHYVAGRELHRRRQLRLHDRRHDGRTDTGSVAVTVTAVNDQPVAADDTRRPPRAPPAHQRPRQRH